MNSKQLIEKVKALNLPKEQYLIIGSGAMVVRSMREGADIDIVTTPELYNKLAKEYPLKNEDGKEQIDLGEDVEILKEGMWNDSSIVPFPEMLEKADFIEEIPFLNLDHLLIFKQKLNREKDIRDIELIKNFRQNNN